jgi:hypothetical protein
VQSEAATEPVLAVARSNMIDATLTEDFDDEIKALDEQINQLQRRRNVLVTSV